MDIKITFKDYNSYIFEDMIGWTVSEGFVNIHHTVDVRVVLVSYSQDTVLSVANVTALKERGYV